MAGRTQPESKDSWSSSAPRKLLDEITAPGAYVCHGRGDLIRVSGSDLTSDDLEELKSAADEPVYVTLVSEDPFIPISRARIAAANLDVEISF